MWSGTRSSSRSSKPTKSIAVDPVSRSLRVSVTDGRGRAVRDGGLVRWLEATAPRSARGAVAIALVSDVRIRTFNRSYRGKDSATDVLSFPADVTDVPARAPRL